MNMKQTACSQLKKVKCQNDPAITGQYFDFTVSAKT